MKKTGVVIIFLVIACFISSCNPSSENAYTCDPKAISEMKAAISSALDGHVPSVILSDNDSAIDMSVIITIGTPTNFGFAVSESIKAINSILEQYNAPIKEVRFKGVGDSRIITWITSDLKYGKFSNTPYSETAGDFKSDNNMSLSDLLKYCGYTESNATQTSADKQENSHVSNNSKPSESSYGVSSSEPSTSATEESTPDEILGATVYSRAGMQYHQYGILAFGTKIEIKGYENEEWINIEFEGMNAYIEAKYFKSLGGKKGIIINPYDETDPTESSDNVSSSSSQPSIDKPEESSSTPTQEKRYVGSTKSDKYHKPSCRYAKNILPENEIWFASKEEAAAAGYSRCGTCKP